jgi:hypothetical protein
MTKSELEVLGELKNDESRIPNDEPSKARQTAKGCPEGEQGESMKPH